MGVEVSSNVRHVKKAVLSQMEKAARMIGGTVEGHAKELCPVDTGLLRNSITFAIGGNPVENPSYKSNRTDRDGKAVAEKQGVYADSAPEDRENQVTVYVGSNVVYATYQELGAPNINLPARPFLRPAFENFTGEIEQIFQATIGRIG